MKGYSLVLFTFFLVFQVHLVFFLSEAGVVLFYVFTVAILVLQLLYPLVLLLHFFLEFVKFFLGVLMLEQ